MIGGDRGTGHVPCAHTPYMSRNPLLIAYPSEIWQYELRSRGIGVTWVAMVAAIIFNVFVNPIAMAAIGWKFYIIFIVMIVVFGVTTYFFYPETKGNTLEEIAQIFDGDEAATIQGQSILIMTKGKDDTNDSDKA